MARQFTAQYPHPALAAKPMIFGMMASTIIAAIIATQSASSPSATGQRRMGSASSTAAIGQASLRCDQQVCPYYEGAYLRNNDRGTRRVCLVPFGCKQVPAHASRI